MGLVACTFYFCHFIQVCVIKITSILDVNYSDENNSTPFYVRLGDVFFVKCWLIMVIYNDEKLY